jgi:hypothetical protein
MLVLGFKKIKVDVYANRGSPTWKPPPMAIGTNGGRTVRLEIPHPPKKGKII